MSIEVRPVGDGDPLAEPSLHRELAQRYLIWDAFVAGQRRVDVHPLVMSNDLHQKAVRAAEGVVRVIGRVAVRAHDDPRERALYCLRPDVERLASASRDARDDAALVRVDLLLDERGDWRACEINADCPGGHNESLALPRLARAAGFMQAVNPTRVVDALVTRLAGMAREASGKRGAVALLFATAYADDLQVCALVQRALEAKGVKAVLAPPTAPRYRNGDGVFVGNQRVDVLYRYFPTEWMDGQRNVDELARAIARGRVRTLTSFSHIYSQSKFAFTRAWAHTMTMSAEDRDIVAAHVPYSVDVADLTRDELVSRRKDWVVKRAMGRVGDQVFVGSLYSEDDWIPLVDQFRQLRGDGQSWLAQRFVRQRPITTPWGLRYVTLGAYVQDGRFVGYYARVTPRSHVSHEALCVPVFFTADFSHSSVANHPA